MKSHSISVTVPGLGQAWHISRHLFTSRRRGLQAVRSWKRPLLASLAAIVAAVGGWTIGAGLWNGAKALLTDALIARAWQTSLARGEHVKPWPWADAWPVARLIVPALGIERYVLAGGESALELGAHHLAGTALPGESGNSVIGALREEDLAFLRGLPTQAEIDVESMDATGIRYTVRYVQDLDPRDVWITKQEGPTRLTLITCASSQPPAPGKPPCYAVSAYALEGERLARRAPAVDRSAGSALPQNTMFGRKTRV